MLTDFVTYIKEVKTIVAQILLIVVFLITIVLSVFLCTDYIQNDKDVYKLITKQQELINKLD